MARLAVALILALVAAVASSMFPPLVSQQPGLVEHGWPLPWLFQQDIPGSSLPIIGWLFQTAETATTTFSVVNFVLDFAVFAAILFLLTNVFARNSGSQRRRGR